MPRTTIARVLTLSTLAGLSTASAEPAPTPAAAASTDSAAAVDLRPRFKAGDTHRFSQRIVRTDTMSLSTGGQPMGDKPGVPPVMRQSTKIDQTVDFVLKVESASAEGASLTLEIAGIKAAADMTKGRFEWDSSAPADDKDASNPVLGAYKPLVGSVTRLTLDKDGRITDVSTDARLPAAPRNEFATPVMGLATAEQIKARWSSLLAVRPAAEPAAVGSTWTQTSVIANPSVGRFETDQLYTLKSVQGDAANLDIAGTLKLLPFAADKPAQGSFSDAKASGSAIWDLKAGLIREQIWTQQSTLSVNAGGMPIVRDSDIRIETRRKD